MSKKSHRPVQSRTFIRFLVEMSVFPLVLVAASSGWAQSDAPFPAQAPRELVDELKSRFIFVFDDSVPRGSAPGRAEALARDHGGEVIHHYTESIRGFAARMAPEAAARLAGKRPIAWYEPDQIAWAVPSFDGARKPPKPPPACTGQTVDWGVARVGGFRDGTGKTAWVIDTGVDLDHRDLLVDRGRAISFVGRSADDGNGHGTHVSGIIAARNNSCDTVGVAAGATIVPVKVLGNGGSGFLSDVIAGVDYVAANAAPGDVANMSLGGGPSPSLDEAILAAAARGIFFAIAAGNEGDSAMNHSPARVEDPYVFTVSAIGSDNVFAWFSNYGNPPIEYAAPGVQILSLYKGGGTATLSGTSMAAPHVAAILLLNGGAVGACGSAIDDRDGYADPIACLSPASP